MARGERSQPTNWPSGRLAAIGSRLAPSLQPNSRTRQVATLGGARPNNVATTAMRSGCESACDCPWYGTASYFSANAALVVRSLERIEGSSPRLSTAGRRGHRAMLSPSGELVGSEGAGQQLGQRVSTLCTRVVGATDDQRVGAKFMDDLPTRTARRGRRRGGRINDDDFDPARALRDGLKYRIAFSADGEAERSVLDIRAGVNLAIRRKDRGADRKAAVWRVGALRRFPGAPFELIEGCRRDGHRGRRSRRHCTGSSPPAAPGQAVLSDGFRARCKTLSFLDAWH